MTGPRRTGARVVVVGGGIAGIAAVTALLETDSSVVSEVVWVEAENRWGGRVYTTHREGVAIELGAAFALDPGRLDLLGPTGTPTTTWKSLAVDPDVLEHRVDEIGLVAGGVLHRDRNVEGCLAAHLGSEAFDEIFGFGSAFGARLLAATGRREPEAPSRVGDVSALSAPTTAAIGAFHSLIHPGPFSDTVAAVTTAALTAWPCARRRGGNAQELTRLRDRLLDTHGDSGRLTTRLATRVVALDDGGDGEDGVVVHLANDAESAGTGDATTTLPADAVVLATTPSALADLDLEIPDPHAAFYSAATYHPGIVIGLIARCGPQPVRFAVSTDEAWSSVIVGALEPEDPAAIVPVQVYLSGDLAHSGWSRVDTDLVTEVATSLERLGIIESPAIEHAVVHRWREVGPALTPRLRAAWRPGHRRLGPRIVFGGELAAFDGRQGGYGTASAAIGGRLAARDVIADLLGAPDPDGVATSTGVVLEPLLDVHVYRVGGHRPEVVDRRREGDVAFHGLVMAAEPSGELADALWEARSDDGLWEFHRGFHPTLEDSCLVLEGLRVDPTLEDPVKGPERREAWNVAVASLVECFAEGTTGIWRTTRAGRAAYWQEPTVDGAAWGAWLAHQADPERWKDLVTATAEWLWSQRRPGGTWRSGWFNHDEITDFLATRLVTEVEPLASTRTSQLALALGAGPRSTGSVGDSVVATSARLLAWTHLVERGSLDGPLDRARIVRGATRARAWLDSRRDDVRPEPVLHYWFESRTGLPDGQRLFFHAHDRGEITRAWARWACRMWDAVHRGG